MADEEAHYDSGVLRALMMAAGMQLPVLQADIPSAGRVLPVSASQPQIALPHADGTRPRPYGNLKSAQANYQYRPTPASVMPYIKKGTVVCFHDGGNHLQMCTGFENGQPVWNSDTRQGPYGTNFFPNGQDEHCAYAIYQPGANFKIDEAARSLEQLASQNGDYTGKCAHYVRVGALEVGTGRALQAPPGTGAGYSHGVMETLGFRKEGDGRGKTFVPTTEAALHSPRSLALTVSV